VAAIPPSVESHRETGAARRARIGHVFVIVLENKGFDDTFGAQSKAPYLSTALTARGILLSNYFGTGHLSLDNYLAMISGQAATPETRNDCETFMDFVSEGATSDGQAIGHGCVYPASVKTLPDQLSEKHVSWRAYMEDMGNDPAREAATCGHPALNAPDPTQQAQPPSAAVPRGDQYAVRHNPFMYFHSIIDSPNCVSNVVGLGELRRDLASAKRTPRFAFITPNLCNDGHDAPCKDGNPGGLVSADRFLKAIVPVIVGSPAYQRDGLLIITFDEGDAEMIPNPAGSIQLNFPGEKCCNEQPGPNLKPFPQSESDNGYSITYQDFGGDRTGAVLLSPLLKGGAVSTTPFNHYSLLKSLEDVFETGGYLGYAGQAGMVGFFDPASDVTLRTRPNR